MVLKGTRMQSLHWGPWVPGLLLILPVHLSRSGTTRPLVVKPLLLLHSNWYFCPSAFLRFFYTKIHPLFWARGRGLLSNLMILILLCHSQLYPGPMSLGRCAFPPCSAVAGRSGSYGKCGDCYPRGFLPSFCPRPVPTCSTKTSRVWWFSNSTVSTSGEKGWRLSLPSLFTCLYSDLIPAQDVSVQ